MLTETPVHPVLNEQTFQRILEAAFVLQEHNRKMRELEQSLELQSEQLREQERAQEAEAIARKKPRAEEKARENVDYTLTLAQIVEAQHQIQMRHLELEESMAVVAERVMQIAHAAGAGIGILDGATVQYRASAGTPALPVGAEVPLKSAICQANIRTGQVIRTKDVDTEFLFDPEPARARGIRSLVAVPIHYDGNIVGGLELYFDRTDAYAEQDIHTCQLMAGLVTEAMGREAGKTLKKSMADERSSMLAAIEKLQPNLTALANVAPAEVAPEDTRIQSSAGTEPAADVVCWKCANALLPEEQFCGKCGAARAGSEGSQKSMQSKFASAWNAQDAEKRQVKQKALGTAAGEVELDQPALRHEETIPGNDSDTPASRETMLERNFAPLALPQELEDSLKSAEMFSSSEAEELGDSLALESAGKHPTEIEQHENRTESQAESLAQDDGVWTSAVRAQDYLESLSGDGAPNALQRFWNSRRGDFYLGIAIAFVVFVIGWGIWSNHFLSPGPRSRSGSAARHAAADQPQLSAFDRLLISVGLAEAPEAPVYKDKGNPDTMVWVDLNTAQYYCPDSDLYQKTAKGKLYSQREAQMDQFEPAYRKACD
jgi:putative methionine-R-sulfoxide reductase with GAF domain